MEARANARICAFPLNEGASKCALDSGIDPDLNPDLQGLNPLGILDRIIEAAKDAGLRIILARRSGPAGAETSADGLWYSDEYPEDRWIADWRTLASRTESVRMSAERRTSARA